MKEEPCHDWWCRQTAEEQKTGKDIVSSCYLNLSLWLNISNLILFHLMFLKVPINVPFMKIAKKIVKIFLQDIVTRVIAIALGCQADGLIN